MDKNLAKKIFYLLLAFFFFYFAPFNSERLKKAVFESLFMMQDYAREHIVLCLIPALLIAGGIAVFVSKESVIKYFGPKANKILSYSVASISGTILSVCSCTVLPLFGGIYYRGAGLGPAIAFLYSGPAINVLAIVLTARVLGFKLGVARAIGAIVMSVIIGLLMHFIFLKEERERTLEDENLVNEEEGTRPLWQNVLFFASLIGILVFANWGKPASIRIKTIDGNYVTGTRVLINDSKIVLKVNEAEVAIEKNNIEEIIYKENFYSLIYKFRFYVAGVFLLFLLLFLYLWFKRNDLKEWMVSSLDLGMQIIPLLFIGVLVAGFLLGRPGKEALIPSSWISTLVGGNSFFANLFAAVSGALMYFATLTEVPILQGLLGNGMGKGPALSLLLAGPAVSLPSMLVLRKVIGTKKMLIYLFLVIFFSTLFGYLIGPIL